MSGKDQRRSGQEIHTFVQRVPDHCDRIVWRGSYYGLPPQPDETAEAELVCAEAYQVVGSLLNDLGLFDTDMAEKILDNLSEARIVHDDVLPWPSVNAETSKSTKNWNQELSSWSDEDFIQVFDERPDLVNRLRLLLGNENE